MDSQSETPLIVRKGPAARELTYCYVGGCERQAVARGLCSTHYHKAWRKDELPMRTRKSEPLVRETVWVVKDLATKLRKLSRTSGRTVSDICREAIANYVKQAG